MNALQSRHGVRARKAVETTERNGTVGVALVGQYAREAKVALLAGDPAVFEAAARRIEAIGPQADLVSALTDLRLAPKQTAASVAVLRTLDEISEELLRTVGEQK